MILCCVLIKSSHRDEHGSGHGDLKTINSVVYILSHLGNQQHVFVVALFGFYFAGVWGVGG